MNHRIAGVYLVGICVDDGGFVDSTVPYRVEALIPVNMAMSSQFGVVDKIEISAYPAI